MIDYILYTLACMAFIVVIFLPCIGVITYAALKVEKVVTQRRQHRDMLAEIRHLKADQAYAALHDMAEYLRAELKHGGHGAAEFTAYEHCQKNLWSVMENNGIHLDEEYR